MRPSSDNAQQYVNGCQRRSATDDHRPHSVAFGLRISKSGALYILITLLIGFSAVNTGNNLLFLVVAGLLAFMSVTGLAGMLNIKHLIPDLLPPDEVFAGIPSPFRITIKNTSSFLPSFLAVVKSTENGSVLFPVVMPGSVNSGTLQVLFAERGVQSPGRVTITSPYPVGFFIRYWTYEIDRKVTVFPRPLASSGDFGNGDQVLNSLSTRPEHGHSGDVERISPYTGSEPLRLVHWKHSARSDELLVKGLGRFSATPLEIDLDMVPGRDLEERISRVAWLVQRWVSERPVGLRAVGVSIPVGIGRQHGLKILTELALYDRN